MASTKIERVNGKSSMARTRLEGIRKWFDGPNRLPWSLLCLVTALGGVFRLWALDANPPSIDQDEAVGGYDAFCILHSLKDHHGNFLPVLFESFEDWVSPLLTYLTVPFVAVFGLTEWAIRLPGALAGTAAVVLMFVLARQLGCQTWAALFGAMLLAFSPWHVPLSRWAIPPSVLTTMMLFALVTFFWAVDAKGKRPLVRWLLFVVAAALWTYSYPTQKLFAPLAILILLCLHARGRLLLLAGVWAAYLLLVSPMYLMVLRDPTRYNARFNMMALPLDEILQRVEVFQDILIRYGDYLSPDFFFGRGDTNITHHVQGFGAISPVAAAFFFIGIGALLMIAMNRLAEKPGRARAIALLAMVALAPVPSTLVTDRLQLNRTVHAFPLVILVATLGLSFVTAWIAQSRPRQIVGAAVALILTAETAAWWSIYWTDTRVQSRDAFQYGLRKPFLRAIADEKNYDEIHVNGDINQPYIFYLFYARKDPQTLDYREINEHVDGSGNWLNVTKIGKWRFRRFDDGELDGAKLVMRVKTGDRIWHQLFAKGRRLYLQ